MAEIVPNRVEYNVEKGESAGYQEFLVFSDGVQEISFLGLLKLWIV